MGKFRQLIIVLSSLQLLTRWENEAITSAPDLLLKSRVYPPYWRKPSSRETSPGSSRHSRQPSRRDGGRATSSSVSTNIIAAAITSQAKIASTTIRRSGTLLQIHAIIIKEAVINVLRADATVAWAAGAAVCVSRTWAAIGARRARGIIRIVDDSGLLDTASRRGPQRCEHLSWCACLERHW